MKKVFRLFISSTFNDFRKEREILQTKVFPNIKEYTSVHGNIFQPIDLRWGVSDEAQLDQKTLELCLSEVRACKTHIHPNFLIMLGDRYGWVPLPYAIEAQEFEILLLVMSEEEKEEIIKWYKNDFNQLPVSYIIKERTGVYEAYEYWIKEEDKLRTILQNAVNNSNLTQEQKRKYFLSATEAEVEEGIIPYINPTQYQQGLLEKNPSLVKIDPKYIFGLFRDVDGNSQIEDKFIGTLYNEAQAFKTRVKATLPKENILQVSTKQINKDTLEEEYLKEFQEKMTTFLKTQIDNQKVQKKEEDQTPLEVELLAQSFFTTNKRKNFLAQEALRTAIAKYIANKEESQAFVLYGESGRGKSALMAKAIEEAESTLQKRVLYRYVGATPNSSGSKEILVSIFDELGRDIRSEWEKNRDKEDTLLLSNQEKQESFEEFSYRVYSEIRNIKEDVVIFIDAVDQLQNDDQFLWLPQTLPSNVKIIISALEDENYVDDSKYLLSLKTRTKNTHLIPAFEQPLELLQTLLKEQRRTLDEYQSEYFLQQYSKVNSPLYVTIAAQEIKNWKSGDSTQTLDNTQRGIIEEFIGNLSFFYHHNKEFVQRVLGYIYASRDGLSESELLTLLAQDEAFIERMAPETFHENPNKELPLVHWSRLQTQLEPFLSFKTVDGEELMYFFHREFEDVVKEQENQRELHENIIKANQKLILKNQDKAFDTNRWGKLYATLITEYELQYKNENKCKDHSIFMADTKKLNEDWIVHFIHYIKNVGDKYTENNHLEKAISYSNIYFCIGVALYIVNTEWIEYHIDSMNNICSLYRETFQFDKVIEIGKQSIKLAQIAYQANNKYSEFYIVSLTNLGLAYKELQKYIDAVVIFNKSLDVIKEVYRNNPIDNNLEKYTVALLNLAFVYKEINEVNKAIKLENEVLEIRKQLFNKDFKKWAESYTTVLNNSAFTYHHFGDINRAIKLEEESLKIRKKLFLINPDKWIKLYSISLTNLAYSYRKADFLSKAIKLDEELLVIMEKLYIDYPEIWIEKYAIILNNYTNTYYEISTPKILLQIYIKSLTINEILLKKNPDKWIEYYGGTLKNLSIVYYNMNQKEKTIELFTKLCTTFKLYYGEQHNKTIKVMEDLYYLQEDIKKSDLKFNEQKVTLSDFLDLCQFIAISSNEDEASIASFATAFGFIELNNESKQIFSQIIDVDRIQHFENGKQYIEKVKKMSKIPYSKELDDIVKQLKIIFGDESIGRLR